MSRKIILTHDGLMELAFVGSTQLKNGTWILVETIREQRDREKAERKKKRSKP